MKYIPYLLACLLLAGCATTGAQLSAPVYKTLDHASVNATQVYQTGSTPKDVRVKSIIADLGTAKKQVSTISNAYDKQVLSNARAKHRIFIDDCIFAVPIAILGGWILMKALPILALA